MEAFARWHRRTLQNEATAVGVAFGDAAAMNSLRKLVASQRCDVCRTARCAQGAAGRQRPEAGCNAAILLATGIA